VAYRSLGLAYLDEVWFRITKSPEKSIEQAEQMAQKPIALTPDQPPPYNLLSFISRAKKDYDNTVLYARKPLNLALKTLAATIYLEALYCQQDVMKKQL